MHEVFGPHAESLASDHVFSELGNRTVRQALAEGAAAKDVWRSVCDGMQIPAARR